MTRWFAALTLGLIPLLDLNGAAQRPPMTGTSNLSGQVVSDGVSSTPVRRARVTLRHVETGQSRVTITDDVGQFFFEALPPGRVTLRVEKPGYVATSYGAESPRGQAVPISVSEGANLARVTVRLSRGAVITGRVTNASGAPMPNARVSVLVRRVVDGVPTLDSAGIGDSVGVGPQVDDRGVYRAYGLPPGTYFVSAGSTVSRSPSVLASDAEVLWATGPAGRAAPARGAPVVMASTFYPGTTNPDAAVAITLAAGEERSGVDIAMAMVPTATVSGTVVRADGEPVRAVQLHAVAEEQTALRDITTILGMLLRPPVTANGKFTVQGLRPGPYLLIARAASEPLESAGTRPTAPVINDLWAEARVTVTGVDISDVSLVLRPGMAVSGRVRFEATTATAPADLTGISVNLSPPPTTGVSMGVPSIQAKGDGSFSTTGVAPGSYLIRASVRGNPPANPVWVLKSATIGGRDVLDAPFAVQPAGDITELEIVFTDRVTELSGRLIDGAGQPMPQLYVTLFPMNPTLWQRTSRWMRAPVRPATDGTFRLAGLPPGDYYLAALTEFEPNEWYTPAFLEQVIPGAIRLKFTEGEKKIQDVRVAQ